MPKLNLTQEGKQTQAFQQLQCSPSLIGEGHQHLIFLSSLNIILSITAFLGNGLILIALRKESSLHPPSKFLYRCLATTDLCVGIIAGPLKVAYFMSLAHEKWNFCPYARDSSYIASYILSGVSLLTMTAISVDRLLALLLGLRYRQVVSLRRVRVVATCFCLTCVLLGSIRFLNILIFWIIVFVGVILSLAISIFSYMKIYFKLRQHQAQVQGQFHQEQLNGGGIPLNITRYKKTVSSISWVQFVLVACYIPFVVVSILTLDEENTFDVLWSATVTLVYLNSSLNPILYCWKIKEVRQAVKDLIRNYCCLWS